MYLLQPYMTVKQKIARVFGMAVVSGVITQIFFAFFKILVLDAFVIQTNGNMGTYQSEELITYIWITQAFFLISPWSVIWEDLDLIRSGNIAYELIRPVGLHTLFFYRTLSHRLVNTMIRAVPIITFGTFVLKILRLDYYSIKINIDISLMLFILSIICSFILSTSITIFIYSITFYTTSATNFIGIFGSLATILTGNLLPLYLFPDFLQPILMMQPFKGLVDTPAQILTGQYNIGESILYICLQLFWVMAFNGINRIMFKNATKRIVVQGG